MVGTVQMSDYNAIDEGVKLVQKYAGLLQADGINIQIPHPHRWWEYGSGVQLLLNKFRDVKGLDVLDMGAGWSPLGPTLAFLDQKVTECEPDAGCRFGRDRINTLLKLGNHPEMRLLPNGIENIPDDRAYDAVFCVSVLEHLPVLEEALAWNRLGVFVKKGGILYITVDCVHDKNRSYVMDNMRATKYTVEDIKNRVSWLTSCGFRPMGVEDYKFHGPMVFDIPFAGSVSNA